MITKLLIIGKKYYDFTYEIFFVMETEGHIGFIFRYMDPYNYYVIALQAGILKFIKV